MPHSPIELVEDAWTFALPFDELWEGELIALRLADANVLLIKLEGGEVRAYDNRCPHAGSPLNEGQLRLTTLRCAAHHWEFDVRTGDGINPRKCQLASYPVRVVDGAILVRVLTR